MKKLFKVLAIVCMAAMIAVPAMADDNDFEFKTDSEQTQGGANIYLENVAIAFDNAIAESDAYEEIKPCGYEESWLDTFDSSTALGASVDVIAAQISFQHQSNEVKVDYELDGEYQEVKPCGYQEVNTNTAINAGYDGQAQEWESIVQFGGVTMYQRGVQFGGAMNIATIPQLNLEKIEMPDFRGEK